MRRGIKMQIMNNSPTDTQHTFTKLRIKRQKISKVCKKSSNLKMRKVFFKTPIFKVKMK